MCHCQVLGHTQGGLLELTYNPNLPVKTGAGWRSFQGNHLHTKFAQLKAGASQQNWLCLAAFSLCSQRLNDFSWQPVKKPSVKVLETSIKRNTLKKNRQTVWVIISITAVISVWPLSFVFERNHKAFILHLCWLEYRILFLFDSNLYY